MSVSSRGVSTCVETARLPVFGGGGRNAPAQKSGGCCKESLLSVARNLRRAKPQEPIFQNFPKTQRRGGGSRDQMALVADAPRVPGGRRRSREARCTETGARTPGRWRPPATAPTASSTSATPPERTPAISGPWAWAGCQAGECRRSRAPPRGARARRPRRAAASRSPRRTPGSPRRPVRPNEPDERTRTARDERRPEIAASVARCVRRPEIRIRHSSLVARTLPKLRIVR